MTAYAKILIGIPSPRDLPQFAEATDKIPADKIFCKYMREQEAYAIIRENFLAKQEYTHLAILPDDLIVTYAQWQQLVDDLHQYDFPVVCGACNLDITEEHKGMLNVCIDHKPSISRFQPARSYEWLVEGSALHQKLMRKNPPIIKVIFAGFPFMFFRRDVVESFEFTDDREPANPRPYGCCVDVMTCADLYDLDVPIHCDLRVRMQHLKIDDSHIEGKPIGFKPKQVYFSSHK